MKKKALVLAMTAVMAATALAGCSGKPVETTAATTAASTTATTAAATAATTAETTAAGETKAETAAESKTSEASAALTADIDPNGSLAKIKAAGKIVMGTSPDFAPWEFKNVNAGKTEYVGSDIELGKYIAEQLGVELEIKALEFSAIQQAVASGTIDMGISGFAYTEERAEALGLSERYNINSEKGQGLLVMKEKASEYNSAESFAGKKVAAQNASLQQNLVQSQLPSDAKFQPVTTVTDGVMMLKTGKVDALAVSGDNGESLAKAYPEIAMAEFMFDYESEGNVLAVKKGDEELLTAINAIIKDVNEKGLYEEWKAEATALADSLGIETN